MRKTINKHIGALCIIMAMVVAPATRAADDDTFYVTDELSIPMRSGPTNAYRIIGWPKAGEPIQILAKNDDGTQVRVRLLRSGKEGWITARYVSREPASRVLLQDARKQISSLQQQVAALGDENKQLKDRIAQLSGVEDRYREKLALLRNQVEVAEQKALRMADTHYNDLFLKGAMVTLVSVLLGVILGRKRRRKLDW